MTYRTIAALICALMVAYASHPTGGLAQSADRAGRVDQINQAGFQYHAEGVDFLGLHDSILPSARLETDLVGEMALAMEDGSQLVMPPNSEIEIDHFVYDPNRTAGKAVFSLGRGALRVISGRMRSESYQVNTPVATIGVRGTDFTVELAPGSGMVVRVDEGTVEIRPNRTLDIFVVPAGQVWICNDRSCRADTSGDQPVRRSSLGPPRAGDATLQTGTSRVALAATSDISNNNQTRSAGRSPVSDAGLDCAFEIPGWAYERVGLDPSEWPRAVGGITQHRYEPGGLTETDYCPNRVDFAGSETSFSVLGDSGSGDTRILYFVNTLPGSDVFLPGFDDRAREATDAAAYESFMPRIFKDRRDFTVAMVEASLARTAPDQIVLKQRALIRLRHGEHLVTGVTLYRPVTGSRTALFSIPAVVTPRPSGRTMTAAEIGEKLFQNLPYTVAIELDEE